MKHLKIFTLLFLVSCLVYSQDITGDWYGTLQVSGMEIPLIFHITQEAETYSSTMDSPKQGAFGLKANKTSFEDGILKIVLASAGITYEGTYKGEDVILEGTFKQGGLNVPLNLSKNKEDGTGIVHKQALRPQEPKAPFPYRAEEITFYNSADSISLAGTLTLPENPGKYPAVVLISGSGPQDRNSEVFGHKPFLVIADHLTKYGIAVLRFDDRGVKDSEGDFAKATSQDLAQDVQAALDYLKTRKEIDPEKTGLIGHSEGGLIAPMVAKNFNDVDFLVLLAGPGLRGDENLLLQKKLYEQRSELDEITIDRDQQTFREAYKIIRETQGEDLQAKLREHFGEQLKGRMEDAQIASLVRQITTPWMLFYLRHDPATVLEKIDIPVLALFGEKDFQVPPEENAAIVKKSLEKAGNNEVQVIVFKDLNHLFQESSTGLINEYEEIEQTISPQILQIITSWIFEQK